MQSELIHTKIGEYSKNLILKIIRDSTIGAAVHVQIERVFKHQRIPFNKIQILENLLSLLMEGRIEAVILDNKHKIWSKQAFENKSIPLLSQNGQNVGEIRIPDGNYFSWEFTNLKMNNLYLNSVMAKGNNTKYLLNTKELTNLNTTSHHKIEDFLRNLLKINPIIKTKLLWIDFKRYSEFENLISSNENTCKITQNGREK